MKKEKVRNLIVETQLILQGTFKDSDDDEKNNVGQVAIYSFLWMVLGVNLATPGSRIA